MTNSDPTEIDENRRERLRKFLVSRRSRLRPEDVGLPATSRRRVVGLRQEEVAELVSVSSDWYRRFESGRPIRVSAQFLAKLSKALRLSPLERIGLYYLGFPEVYEAYVAQRLITIPLLASEAA
jgi:transcriptional regulator with XRE-family HTH domain